MDAPQPEVAQPSTKYDSNRDHRVLWLRRAHARVGGPQGRYILMPRGRVITLCHHKPRPGGAANSPIPKPPTPFRSGPEAGRYALAHLTPQAVQQLVPEYRNDQDLAKRLGEALFVRIDHPPRATEWEVLDTLTGVVYGPFASPGTSSASMPALPAAAAPILQGHPYTVWQREVERALAEGAGLSLKSRFEGLEAASLEKAVPHPNPSDFLAEVFPPSSSTSSSHAGPAPLPAAAAPPTTPAQPPPGAPAATPAPQPPRGQPEGVVFREDIQPHLRVGHTLGVRLVRARGEFEGDQDCTLFDVVLDVGSYRDVPAQLGMDASACKGVREGWPVQLVVSLEAFGESEWQDWVSVTVVAGGKVCGGGVVAEDLVNIE